MSDSQRPNVSIVIPVYNEQDNVYRLYEEVVAVMGTTARTFELVVVDDGSLDQTTLRLRAIATQDPRVKLVIFRRNYGQTAAMHAGIQHAKGEILVTLDGDLQNDPADIPMMLTKLDEGYDLVHGWRKDRKDHLLSRKIPSRIANWIISRVTDFPIHDLGCTLKAMRSEIAQQIELYGEMHRFIPILADQLGARSVEVVTNHRPRQFGETKYGIGRTFRVVLDLITVNYMIKYFASPMKLFGKLGLIVLILSFASGLVAVGMKLFGSYDITGNPLTLLAILSTILSVQFFSLGLIGEVCARIYFTAEGRQNYQVRELVNSVDEDNTVIPIRRAG